MRLDGHWHKVSSASHFTVNVSVGQGELVGDFLLEDPVTVTVQELTFEDTRGFEAVYEVEVLAGKSVRVCR